MTEAGYHDARSRFFAKSLRKKQLFRDVIRCLIKRCEISLCAFRRERDGRSSAVVTARESRRTCSPNWVIADYVTNTAFTTKGSTWQASWLIWCHHLVRQTTGDNFKNTPRIAFISHNSHAHYTISEKRSELKSLKNQTDQSRITLQAISFLNRASTWWCSPVAYRGGAVRGLRGV